MAWMPLSRRLNDLPLILAGPVLRRTDRNAVSVWLALKESRTVTLRIYAVGDTGKLTEKLIGTSQTITLGTHLHLAVVTATTAQGEPPLNWGQLYYYNLFFQSVSQPSPAPETADNLNTPGVLNKDLPNSPKKVQLFYPSRSPHPLPSFAMPPGDLNKLRIIHASCRKPHGESRDAMAALDGMIEASVTEPAKRPHHLFLTGDQIYADDVADALLLLLTDAGDTLLGWEETLPGITKKPKELKPGQREDVAEDDAGLTSDEAKSHLLGLGEFYAMYLFCWSLTCWPANMPTFADVFPGEAETYSDGVQTSLFRDFKREIERLTQFRQELNSIRRALANVPTYMIFDDHEITDDWYLRLEWCQDVLGKPLGRRVVQNGLLAYALFQAWGNTPNQFEANQPGAKLLQEASTWRGQTGDQDLKIKNLLGIPDLHTIIAQKALIHPDGALDWHYRLNGPNYTVIVLDTRTWRGFPEDDDDPPALLTATAFERQIPKNIQTNPEVILVISPTPVIGVPFADSVQDFFAFFLSNNYVDYEAWRLQRLAVEGLYASLSQAVAAMNSKQRTRLVLLCGDVHYGYAIRMQYWAEHPFNLLGMAPTSNASAETPVEFVLAQLTSSALKNQDSNTQRLHNIGFVFDIFSDSLPDSRKWAGWNIPPGKNEVQIGTKPYIPFLFFIQKPWLLDEKPAMLYLNDLTASDHVTVDPDWRYRIDFLLAENDISANDVRGTPPFKPGEFTPPIPGEDRKDALKRYLAVAEDHEDYARKWGDGKEVVGVNNFGEVTFQWSAADHKTITQQLWWRLESRTENNDNDNLLPLFPLTKHIISLRFDDPNYPKPEIAPGEN